jgi:hypothetical protein
MVNNNPLQDAVGFSGYSGYGTSEFDSDLLKDMTDYLTPAEYVANQHRNELGMMGLLDSEEESGVSRNPLEEAVIDYNDYLPDYNEIPESIDTSTTNEEGLANKMLYNPVMRLLFPGLTSSGN